MLRFHRHRVSRKAKAQQSRYWRKLQCPHRLRTPAFIMCWVGYRWHGSTHEAFAIAATEVGVSHITTGETTEPVFPGTLFISNPGELQSSSMDDSKSWRYRSIY